MTHRTYGLLASVIGLGAWWYARRRASSSTSYGNNSNGNHRVRERGTVIFDNTPAAAELPGEA
ncbi:hypothetical protein BH18ACI5_BH18ACI5_02290 [soil metagenome]